MMTLCGSQMFRRANLALVGLTVLLVSNVAHAAPPTAITTCPFVITTPVQYYLANDLLGCPGPGIIIAASGVRLRLDGHAIQGSGHGDGIGAMVQTDLLIQGPSTITGFAVGVSFVAVDFSNVIGVTATGNEVGFHLTGIFEIGFSDHNVIQGNVATENDFDGIAIGGGSENAIVNNLVTNNDLGIVLFGGTDLNEVHANIVVDNSDTGILVGRFSTENNIDGNIALGNGGEDMLDLNPDCDDNQWRGNRFDTAFPSSCIQ